jgi:hypothetical protein
MSKNYRNVDYWESKPEIVKIFDDLDSLLDFCRFEMLPFNEADLYNRSSHVWRSYENSKRGYRDDNKPREWKKQYNRSGNTNRNNYQR